MPLASPIPLPEALARPGHRAAVSRPSVERPYLTAAIAVILTLGALWGVILLLRIATQGSFTAVSIHEVNAHGHAQILGWVGLFVMGIAYRVLPGLLGRELPAPGVARVAWVALLVGVVLRAGLQPYAVGQQWALSTAHVGSVLEIGVIGAFTAQMLVLLRGRPAQVPAGAVWLLRAGAACFLLQTIASAVYFHRTATAPDYEALLWLISHVQPPLRDLQVHGFSLLFLLGFGMVALPRWFAVRPVSNKGSKVVAAVLIGAVLAEIAGFLLMRLAGYRWSGVWFVGALGLLGGVLWIVRQCRLLSPFPMPSRGEKFLRAAHGWLLLSLLMLALLPVWQFGVLRLLAPESHAVEIGFSHAYYGAIRHAVTVGFVSLMILGLSIRLVERTARRAALPAETLALPFLLVNLGCFLRVAFQAATDFQELAFPVAGVSGIFELAGIGVWAAWLLRALWASGTETA